MAPALRTSAPTPVRTPLAACADPAVDPAAFFPDSPEQLATAQAVCGACPLSAGCLEDALALGTSDGVWGGVLLERGNVVPQKRRPGRPRKAGPAAAEVAA